MNSPNAVKIHTLANVLSIVGILCLPAVVANGASTEMSVNGGLQSVSLSKSVPGQLSYQGSLFNSSDGTPVDATLAMVFRIYDAGTSGIQQWSETHSSVEVGNGQFHVALGSVTPFPAGLFDGSSLWLQMEVGSDVFSPRIFLGSVAYSFRANSAEKIMGYTFSQLDSLWLSSADLYHLDASDGNPADAVYVDTEGNVGIGTSFPSRTLHVAGDVQATAYHGDGSNLTGIATGDSDWTVAGNDMYAAVAGSVGIGTASPSSKLEVLGIVDADGFTVNGTPVGTSSGSYWSLSGSDIYYGSGKVGIGTATPTARLQVVEDKGFEGSFCTGNAAVYGSNGSNWGSVAGDSGGVYAEFGTENRGMLAGAKAGVAGYSDNHRGLFGKNNAYSKLGWVGGPDYAVFGVNENTDDYGAIAGADFGVSGVAISPNSNGVTGQSMANGCFGYLGSGLKDYGVYGYHGTSANYGALGTTSYGAYGHNTSTGNYGWLGGSGGSSYGACGVHASTGNLGLLGSGQYGAFGQYSNGNWGIFGDVDYGAYGEHNNGNYGSLGGAYTGAYGSHNGGNYGSLADENHGVYAYNAGGNTGFLASADVGARGRNDNGNFGSLGDSNNGVFGKNSNNNRGGIGSGSYGVWGVQNNGNYGRLGTPDQGVKGAYSSGNFGTLGTADYGAYGEHTSGNYGYIAGDGTGVYGWSKVAVGVAGKHSGGNYGWLGTPSEGIYAKNANGNAARIANSGSGVRGRSSYKYYGYLGGSVHGVYGADSTSGNYGYIGHDTHAVYGYCWSGTVGWLGSGNFGVYGYDPAGGDGHAGYFHGAVQVTGSLSKGGGSFKIDHPLDPENKYLYHSFVESPDMMNVYNGNATLDGAGEAWVELPDWFETLNRDFRYQLTCVGAFAPVYIAEVVSGNRFMISGGEPGMTVSWQVTGIRQDPFANTNRIPVEEDKRPGERGYYLHPEAYGKTQEQGVTFAAYPEVRQSVSQRRQGLSTGLGGRSDREAESMSRNRMMKEIESRTAQPETIEN